MLSVIFLLCRRLFFFLTFSTKLNTIMLIHIKTVIFAQRYQILIKENGSFQEDLYLSRDYTNKHQCTQITYNPNKLKKNVSSSFFDDERWEIQPRRYYDTLNIVIILKVSFYNSWE